MEVQKEINEEEIEIEVPNLIGLTIKDAKEKVKELEMEIYYEQNEEVGESEEENNKQIKEKINEEETIIKDQLPKPGIKIKQQNKISIQY